MSMGKGYFQEISNRTVPERTPKPKYLRSRSQLTERGPLGFGPIQFLFQNLNPPKFTWIRHGYWARDIFPLLKAARICFNPFQPPNQGTPSPEVPRSSRLWPRGGFLVVRVFGPQNHSGRKKGRIPGSWENLHRTWKWMACCQRKIIWNPPPPWLGVQKPLIVQGVSFLVGGCTNPFETYAQFSPGKG